MNVKVRCFLPGTPRLHLQYIHSLGHGCKITPLYCLALKGYIYLFSLEVWEKFPASKLAMQISSNLRKEGAKEGACEVLLCWALHINISSPSGNFSFSLICSSSFPHLGMPLSWSQSCFSKTRFLAASSAAVLCAGAFHCFLACLLHTVVKEEHCLPEMEWVDESGFSAMSLALLLQVSLRYIICPEALEFSFIFKLFETHSSLLAYLLISAFKNLTRTEESPHQPFTNRHYQLVLYFYSQDIAWPFLVSSWDKSG